MLCSEERAKIGRLWARKLDQDASRLPPIQRHRNPESPNAEFLHAIAAGIGARRLVEIGGSSGISTIALAAAARETSGRLLSLEIEPARQAEARETVSRLGLGSLVDFVLADGQGGIVVADNIISHSLAGYVAHALVRAVFTLV